MLQWDIIGRTSMECAVAGNRGRGGLKRQMIKKKIKVLSPNRSGLIHCYKLRSSKSNHKLVHGLASRSHTNLYFTLHDQPILRSPLYSLLCTVICVKPLRSLSRCLASAFLKSNLIVVTKFTSLFHLKT